jgi:hypothetical protein
LKLKLTCLGHACSGRTAQSRRRPEESQRDGGECHSKSIVETGADIFQAMHIAQEQAKDEEHQRKAKEMEAMHIETEQKKAEEDQRKAKEMEVSYYLT